MHERSLVKGLIGQVLEAARTRCLGRLHEIQLRIGEFSGVEPRLVEIAFLEMRPEFWETEVRLSIDVVPLTAMCQSCHVEFAIQGFRFVCPACGSGQVSVISGEEMQLVSIKAEPQGVKV